MAMLTIRVLHAGQSGYYERVAAQGRDAYYRGQGGGGSAVWLGAGAEELGLDGEVAPGQIAVLLGDGRKDGRAVDPASGQPLGRARPGAGSVVGLDLTFSAPKSVSVLHGLGDDETRAAVERAHDSAVAQAVGWLDREACVVRRGAGGAVWYRGEGLIVAACRDGDSRAGDPQLHTHAMAANVARGPDGRWTSLTTPVFHRTAKTAGMLFQAALRQELARELGVRWREVGERVDGVAEIDGVPQQVLDEFSRRSTELEEFRRQADLADTRAGRQRAAWESREKKGVHVGERDEWLSRAAAVGFERAELEAVMRRDRVVTTPRALERTSDRLAGPEGLTQHQSTFRPRDVVRGWAGALQQGASVAEVERLADGWLAERGVQVAGESISALGRTVVRDDELFSTREHLALESRLLAAAEDGRDAGAGVVASSTVDRVVDARPTLSVEQEAMVRRLATSGARVDVTVGWAGAGKTFGLAAAREAWERDGFEVRGATLSRQAASVLREEAGIETTSVAALGHRLDAGDLEALPDRAVLVVDEAGMVGTRDLDVLHRAVEQRNGKLVLVGDPRQMPEIHAGGAFRVLAERLDAHELRDVRRQSEPWERDALAAARAGKAREAVEGFETHGRLHDASPADVYDLLVANWREGVDAHDPSSSVMIAHRRADVAELNARAREAMRADGLLAGREVEGADGRSFARGDWVVCAKNDRALDVRNGTRGVVTRAGRDGSLTIATRDGERHLPAAFVQSQTGDSRDPRPAVDHGFAVTGHRVQGATVDRASVLASRGAGAEWHYTALSRARERTDVFAARDTDGPPVGVLLERELRVSRRQEMALERSETERRRVQPVEGKEIEGLLGDKQRRELAEALETARARDLTGVSDRDLLATVGRAREARRHTPEAGSARQDAELIARREHLAALQQRGASGRTLERARSQLAALEKHAGGPDVDGERSMSDWVREQGPTVAAGSAAQAELDRRAAARDAERLLPEDTRGVRELGDRVLRGRVEAASEVAQRPEVQAWQAAETERLLLTREVAVVRRRVEKLQGGSGRRGLRQAERDQRGLEAWAAGRLDRLDALQVEHRAGAPDALGPRDQRAWANGVRAQAELDRRAERAGRGRQEGVVHKPTRSTQGRQDPRVEAAQDRVQRACQDASAARERHGPAGLLREAHEIRQAGKAADTTVRESRRPGQAIEKALAQHDHRPDPARRRDPMIDLLVREHARDQHDRRTGALADERRRNLPARREDVAWLLATKPSNHDRVRAQVYERERERLASEHKAARTSRDQRGIVVAAGRQRAWEQERPTTTPPSRTRDQREPQAAPDRARAAVSPEAAQKGRA